MGNQTAHGNIERNADQSRQGQERTVTQHDRQIKDHHPGAEYQRGEGIHQRPGNHGIVPVPSLDVPGHALGEKGHRQTQDLPQKRAAANHGHFAVDFQGIGCLHRRDDDLRDTDRRQQSDKGQEQFAVFPGEQAVHKESGKRGIYHGKHIADHTRQHDKGNSRSRTGKPLSGKGQRTFPLAVRLKCLPRREHQADAGKGFVKFLHGHPDAAPGRVVDAGAVSAKAAQHHKMIEVPVDDAGENSVFPDCAGIRFESLHGEAIALGSFRYIFGVGPVPRDAAVHTDLFQRDPFPVVGQHHRQAGRAALQRLHLHDNGNLGCAPDHGLSDFSFMQSEHRLQLKSISIICVFL